MLKKYKITLLILAILIIFNLAIGINYLNYKHPEVELEQAFVYVDGDLSFNYMDGNIINTQTSRTYQFSITNTSSLVYYYNLSLKAVSGGENVTFKVQSSKEGFQEISKTFPISDYKFASTIKINGNETHSYTLTINNSEEKLTQGTIAVDLEKDMNSFANMILKNNIVNTETKTNIGEMVATEEEGLIESSDDYGTSYYFRGNVTNNYATFAGLSWRIVKINGDGTVKLILNELINNNTQFSKPENYDLTFENTNIYQSLLNWYQSNLNDYDTLIANNKFCTDNTYDDKGFSSIARIYTNHAPIFQCLGETSITKIGLLTADEISLAGATNHTINQSYYLHNSSITSSWWTMSPAKNNGNSYSYIEVSKDGLMNDGTVSTLFRGLRPVINISKKVIVTGSGTSDDPFVVSKV